MATGIGDVTGTIPRMRKEGSWPLSASVSNESAEISKASVTSRRGHYAMNVLQDSNRASASVRSRSGDVAVRMYVLLVAWDV
jgi:hypothetical protein